MASKTDVLKALIEKVNDKLKMDPPVTLDGNYLTLSQALKKELNGELYDTDKSKFTDEEWDFLTNVMGITLVEDPAAGADEQPTQKKTEPKPKPTTGKSTTERPTAPRSAGPGKKIADGLKEFAESMIKEGRHTRKAIIAACQEQFPERSLSSIQTLLTDAKNEKYCRFASVAKEDKAGVMSF